MGTFDRILGRRVMAGNLDPVFIMRDRTRGNLDAALEDRAIGGAAIDYVSGAAQVVLTEGLVPGISYNILERQVAIITSLHYGLHTANDNCHFEVGYTDAIDGGGAFTPLMPALEYFTGAAQDGPVTKSEHFDPYLAAWYRKGARSITFRVHANDATCEITCHWHGFYITE